MSENWDFYYSDFADDQAVVRIDLSAGDEGPDSGLPCLLRVDIPFEVNPTTGGPTEEESEAIGEIEEGFSTWIEKKQKGAFVASVLLPARRALIAYVRTDTLAEADLRSGVSALQERSFTLETTADPEWDTYFKKLYPDERQQRWMADRQLVDFMESQGDQLAVPRQVDFTAFFPTEEDRDLYLNDALECGFQPEPEGNPSIYAEDGSDEKENADEGASLDPSGSDGSDQQALDLPFSLTVVRETAVDLDTISELTEHLCELALKHNGLFDGWACFPVVPENDDANRRRSDELE